MTRKFEQGMTLAPGEAAEITFALPVPIGSEVVSIEQGESVRLSKYRYESKAVITVRDADGHLLTGEFVINWESGKASVIDWIRLGWKRLMWRRDDSV